MCSLLVLHLPQLPIFVNYYLSLQYVKNPHLSLQAPIPLQRINMIDNGWVDISPVLYTSRAHIDYIPDLFPPVDWVDGQNLTAINPIQR